MPQLLLPPAFNLQTQVISTSSSSKTSKAKSSAATSSAKAEFLSRYRSAFWNSGFPLRWVAAETPTWSSTVGWAKFCTLDIIQWFFRSWTELIWWYTFSASCLSRRRRWRGFSHIWSGRSSPVLNWTNCPRTTVTVTVTKTTTPDIWRSKEHWHHHWCH